MVSFQYSIAVCTCPIQSRLCARVVHVSDPSGVDGGWLWSDSCPWSCVVHRVRHSVLVSPSPLVLRNGGTGCGSRRFGRRARLGMAPLPVVPTYSRGLGGIVVIHYVYCGNA